MPNIYWVGTEGDYNIMVMEMLGPSLETLFVSCGRKLSLKTALMVADQLVSRIECLHAHCFVHRDVKPDNFLVGLGTKASIIHMIDFGLSKQYKDPRTGQHVSFRTNKLFTGTARYASANAHLGYEQSRRDDLEGLFNVVIYLMKGRLPWQGLPGAGKEDKYRRIMEVKRHTNAEVLCRGLPSKAGDVGVFVGEMCAVVNYCRRLRFEDEPNYMFIKQLLKDAFTMQNFDYDLKFDWTQAPSSSRGSVISQTLFRTKASETGYYLPA